MKVIFLIVLFLTGCYGLLPRSSLNFQWTNQRFNSSPTTTARFFLFRKKDLKKALQEDLKEIKEDLKVIKEDLKEVKEELKPVKRAIDRIDKRTRLLAKPYYADRDVTP